jgi:hypothetical protein
MLIMPMTFTPVMEQLVYPAKEPQIFKGYCTCLVVPKARLSFVGWTLSSVGAHGFEIVL